MNDASPAAAPSRAPNCDIETTAFVAASFGCELLNAIVEAGAIDRGKAADLLAAYRSDMADFPESPLLERLRGYFDEAEGLMREGRA